MLIIFGFRGRSKTLSTGEFFCPRCGVDRSYAHQAVRRWFTLFFVPICPTGGVLGEHVRCGTCQTCFRTDVLQTPTSAALGEHICNAMRMCVVAMLLAGDRVDPRARLAGVSALRAAGLAQYDDAALDADLHELASYDIAPYVTPLATGLNGHGQETFVAHVARVALADGTCADGERAVLERIGASLGLSVAHLNGIIGTLATSPASLETPGDETPPA